MFYKDHSHCREETEVRRPMKWFLESTDKNCGDSGQDRNSKVGRKGSDFTCISKENLTINARCLDVGYERKCKIKDDTSFLT